MGKRPRTEEDEETAFPRGGGGGGEKKMAQPDESSAFPRGGGGGGVTHEQRPIKASKKKAPRMFTDEVRPSLAIECTRRCTRPPRDEVHPARHPPSAPRASPMK